MDFQLNLNSAESKKAIKYFSEAATLRWERTRDGDVTPYLGVTRSSNS